MKIERVNAEIGRELSKILNYEIKDPRLDGVMLSVVAVETTKDLKYAKVFISLMNAENPKEVLKALTSMASFLKNELFKRLKIRAVPELLFKLDESAEYGLKIEKILSELNITPEEGGDN